MTVHHLPTTVTSFIGRSEEVQEVVHLLSDSCCRLLTLIGLGGTGKTRLAIQAANLVLDKFSDGVHFIPLAPLKHSKDIPVVITRTLGFYSETSALPHQQVVDYLANKQLLLLLDNLEHLLEGCRELVAEILNAAPQVKILATARQPLSLQEEWVRQVMGLPFPLQLGEDIERYGAVQLFADRVYRVHKHFSLLDNQAAVIHICRLVEGLPLALEFAASWIRILSCHQIAGEIERNLGFLTSPLHNVPERHRSIRALFEHSWRLLSQEEQHIFASLSVFKGGFIQAAAESITGATLPTLNRLVDKSLLQMNVEGRYSLHELVRQFAAEKLALCGERDRVREEHSYYYLRFVGAREADTKGSRQLDAVRELAQELSNMREAWTTLLLNDLKTRLASQRYISAYARDSIRNTLDTIGELVKRLSPNQGADQYSSLSVADTLDKMLTRRELEVLFLIAGGLSDRAIAERLVLSLATVKWHNRRIFEKLDVRSRTQAIARARDLRLID